jgi:superfamily II DNA or RNA helicase
MRTTLIADEVHHLGRAAFVHHPPTGFHFRLGLSATPARQYDPAGTLALEEYFGPVLFELPLDKVIGVTLVPYDYYPHLVDLEPSELELWLDLTDRLRRLGFGEADTHPADEGDRADVSDAIRNLLIRRRAIVECAAHKLQTFADQLAATPRPLMWTLVYASAKNPAQLSSANDVLGEAGVFYRQLTAEETGRGIAEDILTEFARKNLEVLTAKRVLDEGINIPAVHTAHLLASSGLEREWVQRRGRILRRSPETNKTHAAIHDYVVHPTDTRQLPIRSLRESELARVAEFTRLSRNAALPGGGLEVMRTIGDSLKG